MPDGSALFVFQSIYEPKLAENGKWVVNYKNPRTNKWEEESFAEHEKAYDYYWKQTKMLQDYYNVFLRELRMGK